ncbi:MAG: YraN family protein [Gammaproteobacteria bacterium]|nr:YraN family protein [Gammaproteobacteria bacterium]
MLKNYALLLNTTGSRGVAKTSKGETGKRAEDAACDFLRTKGLSLVERNYLCPRGEIDLIMRDARTTVFVEVRYRRSSRFGSGAESVDWRKQRKLLATAAHYLLLHPKAAKQACRFDVVSLSGSDGHAQLDWIPDAFQA